MPGDALDCEMKLFRDIGNPENDSLKAPDGCSAIHCNELRACLTYS
jgi:hypothetical protein